MEDNKGYFVLAGILIVFLGGYIAYSSVKVDKDKENKEIKQEYELNVDQIWFKNIEVLVMPIDQSLLAQDKIELYFREQNKDVDEVEIIKESFKDLGEHKYTFKATYKDGEIEVNIDKDIVEIKE